MKPERIHMEHCTGCSDPLCKVIPYARVTDQWDEVTCPKCLALRRRRP